MIEGGSCCGILGDWAGWSHVPLCATFLRDLTAVVSCFWVWSTLPNDSSPTQVLTPVCARLVGLSGGMEITLERGWVSVAANAYSFPMQVSDESPILIVASLIYEYHLLMYTCFEVKSYSKWQENTNTFVEREINRYCRTSI